jgi:hypothetical protein
MAFDDGGERVDDLKMIGSKVRARAATAAACGMQCIHSMFMAAQNLPQALQHDAARLLPGLTCSAK